MSRQFGFFMVFDSEPIITPILKCLLELLDPAPEHESRFHYGDYMELAINARGPFTWKELTASFNKNESLLKESGIELINDDDGSDVLEWLLRFQEKFADTLSPFNRKEMDRWFQEADDSYGTDDDNAVGNLPVSMIANLAKWFNDGHNLRAIIYKGQQHSAL